MTTEDFLKYMALPENQRPETLSNCLVAYGDYPEGVDESDPRVSIAHRECVDRMNRTSIADRQE